MTEKSDILSPPQFSESERQEDLPPASPSGKKKFVEPEVSFPIDVLEATTFFVPVDSGVVTP